jgi:DNA topoisomerase-1
LQQEANRKLHLPSRDTMRVAQGLYERGYITYMRTDSTNLSEQAIQAARNDIRQRYGAAYLPPEPRVYKSTVRNAQEAHEAIRPAGDTFRDPESLKGELEERELKLYDMVGKRTVASQMPNARGQRTTMQLGAGKDGASGAVFQATGKTIEFPGYLRAYVEGSDDPEADIGDQERILPALQVGDGVNCSDIKPVEHVTQAPARFSEASLIKELERQGIGRPSTYASIIATIIGRDYVLRRGNQLVPSFMAFAVVQLLEQNFGRLVDLGFTAQMEDALDAISRGESESQPYLKEFYFGAPKQPGLKELLKVEIDPRKACTIPLGADSQDRPISIRIGRYGPYLERVDERASIPVGVAPDELTLEMAEQLLARGNVQEPLGSDPVTGKNVYVKTGRFGPYVQLGETPEAPPKVKGKRVKKQDLPERPKMKSLLPGQTPETLTLADALKVLSLPRTVGTDPANGEPILADLGRFGPYIKRGEEFRSLLTPESVFYVTQEEALALLAQPKKFRRGQPQPIREVGKDPQTQLPIRLMNGRFGPYVTDGEINASLQRGTDPAQLTLEEALNLIANRRAAGPPLRRSAPRRPAGRAAKAATSDATPAGADAPEEAGRKRPVAKKSPRRSSTEQPEAKTASGSSARPTPRKKRVAS